MTDTQTKTLRVFAPAKINLYLHVTGRLDHGYHTLDSLIAFTDIGDQLTLSPSPDFQFTVDGVFAKSFGAKDLDASPSSSNLVVQATWTLARIAQKTPDVHAHLTKDLPLGSGIGGGSSDAAAMIWGLTEWWNLPKNASYLPELLAKLGADVPVCLPCQSARVRGIGDILDPVPAIPETPIVLVYPGKPCSTADVFMRYQGDFKATREMPAGFGDFDHFIGFLEETENDLLTAACESVPEIANILQALSHQKGCALSRLTGSGSSCFGLFEHEHDAAQAAESIREDNPDWWVHAGWLGRPERY